MAKITKTPTRIMATSTSPLKNKDGKILSRRFTGKTSNFKDKEEQKFFQKALKAYAKGNTHFPYGKTSLGLTDYKEVPQEYFYI